MPTNHLGRLTIIAIVLFCALWAIFPSGNLAHPNLKPGIDMVGGTSLLYEIKAPEGGWTGVTPLSESVMDALKKRVDPDGVRNLIWRPQGNTRLEIQMPTTPASAESRTKREEFAAAQRELDATNLRPSEVLTAIEDKTGKDRDDRLAALTMGDPDRAKIFADLVKAYDAIAVAHTARNAAAEAQARANYDDLSAKIADTNLLPNNLQDTLNLKGDAREAKLNAFKSQAAHFPQRLTAINDFTAKYDSFSAVKGTIDDAGELKRLLRGSGVLEFHIMASDLPATDYQKMVEQLKTDGPRPQANDTTRWYEVENPEKIGSRTVEHDGKQYALAYTTPDRSLTNREGQPHWALTSSTPEADSGGGAAVGFNFDAEGAHLFSDMTGHNVNRSMAIVLDNKLISAANIISQINSNGIITGGTGGFSHSEQAYLISILNAGSLPAQLTDEPISEVTVGPALGAENLRAGLRSCYVGLGVVGVFLIGYYYLSGVVAFVAVCINLLLILGVMAMLNATFTLPGVAGIVLSIGAAVDANVLIFERLREEQEKGLSLNMALRNAYGKAWSAIVDSNATTVITSCVLLLLGSEEVKGFGITLLIGLISSLFTALFVTKTIFAILIDRGGVKSLGSLPLTFPKWDRMLKPHIDWMSYVWPFIGLSAVLLIGGLMAFGYYGKKGQLLDIDFAGGTSVQFELKQPMPREDVEKLIVDAGVTSPSVVAVGADQKTYSVDTPDTDTRQVQREIVEKLGDRVNLQRASTFDRYDQPLDVAINSVIIPVSKATPDAVNKAAGFEPNGLPNYDGGAAIVLKNLNPPLSPNEIRLRIERQRLQPQAGEGQMQASREFSVAGPGSDEEKTATAVILVADPLTPYTKDKGKWTDNLVAPAWALVHDALAQPPQFQKVNSFNAQVAGDTERDAITALVLSLVVILAYIWLRFGNLKYGTATVVAMLHDTLIVIGAVGLAHLAFNVIPPLAKILLLEPFRLNLTLVASILTVMSYSMIDTIVVFDRIRENRGKYGHLDRKVVNDSINQTLSRTLLTAGTNVLTVAVMYFFGGPGIHGFTFVLLFGILIGTYSSIAIAAPFLLLSRQPHPQGSGKTPGSNQPPTLGRLQRA